MAMSDEDYGRLMANSENTSKKLDKMSDTMENFITSVPCQNHEARIEGNKERVELAHVRITDHKEKADTGFKDIDKTRLRFTWKLIGLAVTVIGGLVSLMMYLKG